MVVTKRQKETPKQYQVDRIIAHKYEKGVCLFKVRWEGYTAKDDTWEPHESFASPVPVIEYYSQIPGKRALSCNDHEWWFGKD